MLKTNDYLDNLKKRGKESRVYRKHQLIGLEIADILNDRAHKTLYIKLAKEQNADQLLGLAKRVAEKKDVESKGAYFMRIVTGKKNENPRSR